VFANWLQQDYLFVRGGVRFIATLAGRAPEAVALKLEIFWLTAQYELRLWEMAYRGETWGV
jgi:thiaminase